MKKLSGRNTLKVRHGPGVWEDTDGNLHFSLPELLTLADLPDTPENRAIVTAMLRKQIAEESPTTIVRERETPDD